MATYPDEASRNRLADGCERCPDLVACRDRIAWGNGPLDADLLVVGEAPAAGDPGADRWRGGNLTGMAYTARHSGRRIRDLLAEVGYGAEACYFTNAVKCYPADGDGGNREPTPAERANCRPYLAAEIETVDPGAVVTTGKHATASVLSLAGRSLDGFLDRVLDPIPCEDVATTVVPVLHPSYQDVWRSRLGYSPAGYRDALAATLSDALRD